MYTAKSLDTAQGQAVNEHTNRLWFDVVEEVQLWGDDGKPIAPECTWAMDENSFQANGGEGFECVIGAKGKKVQYQQQAGTRENITVLLTIGASGVVLPPVALYSGKRYLIKWQQENPVKASYVALPSEVDWANHCLLASVILTKDGLMVKSVSNMPNILMHKLVHWWKVIHMHFMLMAITPTLPMVSSTSAAKTK